ncbi:MAG: GNAT family N-acetyltransferase [Chloroflexota bacterium]
MRGIRIRRSVAADVPYIRESSIQTAWESLPPWEREGMSFGDFQETMGKSFETFFARPSTTVFVAEGPQGQVLGYVWLGETADAFTGEKLAWVYDVTVEASQRGQGLGQRLMRRAESFARRRGYRHLGLMVAWHNLAAQGLYGKLGFRAIDLIMRKELR